jgi:hypothetical protein
VTNRTNRPDPPEPGPWPKVTGTNRLYDHGAPWCVNAAGHPPREDGYPNPGIHVPPFECRSVSLHFDGVYADLGGPAHGVEVYLAQPFQFGRPRTAEPAPSPRVVFEYLDKSDEPVARFSLTIADALRLALELLRLVTAISPTP